MTSAQVLAAITPKTKLIWLPNLIGAKPDWSELKKRTNLPLWEARRDTPEMRPRYAGDAPEIHPRYTRDAPEIHPRCPRDAPEMQPRCARDAAEVRPISC